MRKSLIAGILICAGFVDLQARASGADESGVREFIAQWNKAYTGMDALALAALETPDFEMVDRFGHWIKPEFPGFNEKLWALTFNDIYHGKPGPARQIEGIRFLAANVALVQARANHANGVTLDDGTHIPPFWEIDTYTLVKTSNGWRVSLLNIHNQIGPGTERPGERVPNGSEK
jgi:ketosteroid isomerase-like protein